MVPPTLLSALCALCSNPTLSDFSPCIITPTRVFSCFRSLNLLFTSCFCFFFFLLFPSPLQQIKKSKTTTLVSATCPTWQQEALFPCMFSKSVKTRWVHKCLVEVCRRLNKVMFFAFYASVKQSECAISYSPDLN